MKKIIVVAVSVISLLITSTAFAVEVSDLGMDYHFESTQDVTIADKVPDIMSYEPPTLTIIQDGKEDLSDEATPAIGIETVYSKNVRTINLPLSYGFPVNFFDKHKERLNLCLTLPYTEREKGTQEDSGLGDISLTTDYLIRLPNLLLDTKLVVKAATGEVEDADVALGSGSYDFGFLVKTTYYFEKFSIKGGLGYTFTGEYKDGDDKIEYGDDLYLSLGSEYNINNAFFAGCDLIYNSHDEDKVTAFGSTYYQFGLATGDLVPNVTYYYEAYNLRITGKAIIPVYEEWNEDKSASASQDPDRDPKFKVDISKPF